MVLMVPILRRHVRCDREVRVRLGPFRLVLVLLVERTLVFWSDEKEKIYGGQFLLICA